VPYTLGFFDAIERDEHFDWHIRQTAEFACSSPAEYERMADEFLGRPLPRPLHTWLWECYRKKPDGTRGDYIRYNDFTGEFGVLSETNVIRTYFMPDPLDHGLTSNLLYFRQECGKIQSNS